MEFTICSRFRDCLSRQIGEALKINMSRDILLNSKSEYLSNSVSRLCIKEDAWERKERTRKEEEEEEMDKKKVESFKRLKTIPGSDTEKQNVSPPLSYGGNESEASQGVGGSVNALTGTMCNIVKLPESVPIDYETDEEEFLRGPGTLEDLSFPAQPLNTSKGVKVKAAMQTKRRKGTRNSKGYQLAYLNLWWSRMAREAKKELEDKLRLEKEARGRELLSMWLRPRDKTRQGCPVFGQSLISSEGVVNHSETNEVLVKHPVPMNIESEGGTDISSGVTVWDQSVGVVLSRGNIFGKTICEQSQPELKSSMQYVDSTSVDRHQVGSVVGLGSEGVITERDRSST